MSPYVRKAIAALAIKGLDFEQKDQMPFVDDPEYRKISPLGKIPALEDGDAVMCDSTIVCEYLDEAYPENPVYPKNPADRAKARWLEEYGDDKVGPNASGLFFHKFVMPMIFKQPTDEAAIAKIIDQDLPPILDYLESQVPEEGFFFGDFSMADLSLVSGFFNAEYAGYTVDAERWSKTAAFIERVRTYPVMTKILGDEAKLIALMG